MLWSIVLSLTIASGAVADSVSLFNVDPGVQVSAYSAGVTNGVTTYLLGCNATAAPTGDCNFIAPLTLVQGPNTFHVQITKSLEDGVMQSLTVDGPAGTAGAMSVTALNKAGALTTVAFPAASYSAGLTAVPVVASAKALLWNGIPYPTSSSTSSAVYNTTSTSSSSYPTLYPTGGYNTTAVYPTGSAPSSSGTTSVPTPVPSKSGASSFGASKVLYAGLFAAGVFLVGGL